ncbi:MAG: IPT/TIG domain-containing protein [Candidatus Hydrogenedentes bacterium]|nr:IPT/TIG domain-containing protein [Candidatus Hydrogenedentota bacterium]
MKRIAQRLLALSIVGVSVLAVAHAQTLLVHTTTLTAAREAVRVYAQTVDLRESTPSALPQLLPGDAISGPVLMTPDGNLAISVTVARNEALRESQPIISLSRAIPLALQPEVSLDGLAVAKPQLHALVDDPQSHESVFVSFAKSGGIGDRAPWQIRARRLATDPAPLFAPQDSAWLLPGEPVACMAIPGRAAVAILCRTDVGVATIHVREVTRGEVLAEALPMPSPIDSYDPACLATTPKGDVLFALFSGYAPEGMTRRSTLIAIETQTFRLMPGEVEFPGDAVGDESALHPTTSGACWVTTRSRSEGFAYAVLIETANGLKKSAEYSFADAPHGIMLAPCETSMDLGVAVGNRLELWRDGKPGGGSITFDSEIGALRWLGTRVAVGEAGCVHFVDALTAAIEHTVHLQTGFVAEISPVLALPAVGDRDQDGLGNADEVRFGAIVSQPDSDGDGLRDGIDVEPTKASPYLITPITVDFRGEGIGQDVRSVRLESPFGENSTWRLDVNTAIAPWLRVYPRTGRLPGWFYVGVDPARFRSGDGAWGTITVALEGATPGLQATGSPRSISVRVLPPSRNPRGILWLLDDHAPQKSLRDESDPWRMKGLADLLAQPPYRFSHRVETNPIPKLPRDVSVIVLTAEAAGRGVSTRQALLDFVSDGGALLFLGQHITQEGPRSLARWLNPIGVELEPEKAVSGSFAARTSNLPARHWDGFRITDGMRMRVADGRAVLVPDPEEKGLAVFAAGAYGNGRIAILASPTPVETSAMQTISNRLFAGDLFTWLSEAGSGLNDTDGDGLPNDVEDKNGNGVVDPGETDGLNADTDGDGIPDGKEDRSRDGIANPGETSPLNPDSDGDGIFDGADPSPLPNVDAPHVDFLEPSRGPLEGGTRVIVNGRNFAPSSRVLFGQIAASRLEVTSAETLLVEAPPAANEREGAVDVRVENIAAGLSGVLPGGFAYTARSTVKLALTSVSVAADQYQGVVALRIDAEPDSSVGLVLAQVKAVPSTRIQWEAVQPFESSVAATYRISHHISEPSSVDLVIMSVSREAIRGDVVLLSWRATQPLPEYSVAKFRINEAKAFALSSQPMNVAVSGLNVPLDRTQR